MTISRGQIPYTDADITQAIFGLGIDETDVLGATDLATQAELDAAVADLVSNTDLARAPFYAPFTVTAPDDEFDDESFSGWTAVNATGTTVTEANDVVSIVTDGTDGAAELHAWTKVTACPVGTIVEACLGGITSLNDDYPISGILMSDGHTAAAGNQVSVSFSPAENTISLYHFTGFNTLVDFTVGTMEAATPNANVFLRLKLVSAGNWEMFTSVDGAHWISLGTDAFVVTPTEIGFWVSGWTSVVPTQHTFRYVRKTT